MSGFSRRRPVLVHLRDKEDQRHQGPKFCVNEDSVVGEDMASGK